MAKNQSNASTRNCPERQINLKKAKMQHHCYTVIVQEREEAGDGRNPSHDDIMPTGWTPAAANSTLEEWTRTFS